MQRYDITEQLGDGTYGSVWKGIRKGGSGDVVRFRFFYFPQCFHLLL